LGKLGSQARSLFSRTSDAKHSAVYRSRWEISIAFIATRERERERERERSAKTHKIQRMTGHWETNGHTSRRETERLNPLLVPRSLSGRSAMQTERLLNRRNVRLLRKFNEAGWQQRCNFDSCNGSEMLQWERTDTGKYRCNCLSWW